MFWLTSHIKNHSNSVGRLKGHHVLKDKIYKYNYNIKNSEEKYMRINILISSGMMATVQQIQMSSTI
jgi:hypothetical protein